MGQPKDPSLIPSGDYCYRFVKLYPGEVVPPAGPDMGRSQRECARPGAAHKEVLCPYFEHTDRRTVRCLFLGQEVLRLGDDPEDVEPQMLARFGTPEAAHWFEAGSLLVDSIKVCGVGLEPDPFEGEDDEAVPALNEVDRSGQPVFRHLWHLLPGDWVEHPQLGQGWVTDVRLPGDGPALVFVNFGLAGEHRLVRDETLLRRVPDPARAATRPPPLPDQELPWLAVTGLVGPGELSNGLQWRRAQGRGPRGVPRMVQAVWPPFTQLGAVLADLLEPLLRSAAWRQSLGGVLWTAAVPAREALLPGLWPPGVACRWLEITDGRLFEVEDAQVEQGVRDLHEQLKHRVQNLRRRAVDNGNWWPAPQRVQLLLADGGRRVGLRLRFADGYQPENRPWVVRWWLHGVSVVHRPTLAEQPPVAPLPALSGRSGLVGPFARLMGGATELPPLPRRRGASSAHAMRMVRAAVPAFQQLRAAMSEITSHPWWCFDEVRRVFWIVDRALQDTDRPITFAEVSRTPARVMNILDWPDEGRSGVASLTVLGKMASLHKRVRALRQAALANGRWWPAPERVELVLVFESWVGMRMRFPDGYQAPWADWLTVWHPMPPRQHMPALPLPAKDLVEAVRAMPRRPALDLPICTLAEAGLRVVSVAQQYPELAPRHAVPSDPPVLSGCVWLLQTHVAGMAYHQAGQAMGQLQVGDLLRLRREPGNVHDALAIEVLTGADLKLGYVPQNRNPVIARLMDAGQTLDARVLSVGTFPRDPQPWQTPVPEVRLRIDWVRIDFRSESATGEPPCST